MSDRDSKRYLSIMRCPNHGRWGIGLDGATSSTRFTRDKCCGRWDAVKQFPVTAEDLRNIVIELECEIDEMETDGE